MLVGRTRELDVLNASFRQMLEGKGSILFLTGEAGLGKTTLVHEWWKSVAPDSAIYAEAACSIPIGNVDVGRLEALQPWADIVAQLETHSEKDKKKFDLKKLIHDAAPSWAWAIPFVGDIAHAAVETTRLIKEQRGPTERNFTVGNQQQVFQQYVNLLTKIAMETPLVILLDDMHWADASSTNLLFYMSRQIASTRILILVTYRPDEAATASNGKPHPILKIKNEIARYETGKELAITRLTREAIHEFLERTFTGYDEDDVFEEWLFKISGGNSLFVTQFIKTLLEDGLVDGAGRFTGDYEFVKIPDSALAVVEERTARLDDATRELLSYATAEGEEFTSYVLEQLSEKKPMQLLKELHQAADIGVIVPKGTTRMFANHTTGIYGFSHALFHKALYDSLLAEQKEYLHRKCYDVLKDVWDRSAVEQERTITLASKLMTHAEKCGILEPAAEAALAAAQSAWHTYAEEETLEMIAHVKRLAAEPAFPEVHRSRILGDAWQLQSGVEYLHGRYEDALNAAGEAFEHYRNMQDDVKDPDNVKVKNAKCSRALLRRANSVRMRGMFDESLAEARKAYEYAKKTNVREVEAEVCTAFGNTYADSGAYDDALRYYTQSLEICESLHNAMGTSLALNNMGILYGLRGMQDAAMEYFTRSLRIREEAGDRYNIAMTLNNLGSTHNTLDHYEEALACHTRGLRIRESIGDRYGIASSTLNIGNVYASMKEYATALEWFRKGLAMWEGIENPSGIAISWINIGTALEHQGALPEAREALLRANEIAQTIKAKSYEAVIQCELGIISLDFTQQTDGAARTAHLQEAASQLEEGVATLRSIGYAKREVYEQKLEEVKKSLNSEI